MKIGRQTQASRKECSNTLAVPNIYDCLKASSLHEEIRFKWEIEIFLMLVFGTCDILCVLVTGDNFENSGVIW